jgi:hypothetical protein
MATSLKGQFHDEQAEQATGLRFYSLGRARTCEVFALDLCQNDLVESRTQEQLGNPALRVNKKSWLTPLLHIAAPFIPGIAITWAI